MTRTPRTTLLANTRTLTYEIPLEITLSALARTILALLYLSLLLLLIQYSRPSSRLLRYPSSRLRTVEKEVARQVPLRWIEHCRRSGAFVSNVLYSFMITFL